MKRVLFIDSASGMGGAERSLLYLAKSNTAYQTVLACCSDDLERHFRELGVPVERVILPRLRGSLRCIPDWITCSYKLAKLVKKTEADILYSNTIRATFYSALASIISRKPFIWHMRDFWLTEEEPSSLWVDKFIKYILILCSSRTITNSYAVAHNMPKSKKLRVVHNGLPPPASKMREEGQNVRDKYGIPRNSLLIGMVGRMRPWKGQIRFLQMASKIAEKLDQAHFLIVGGNPLHDDPNYTGVIKRLTHELGLEDRTVFTGHKKEILPVFAAMDLFVHPGNPEPFGLVTIEAMFMGIPVVALNHGGVPEIVENSETGVLVDPAQGATGLARSVITLSSDTDQLFKMGKAAEKRAREYFDIKRVADQISRIIDDIE